VSINVVTAPKVYLLARQTLATTGLPTFLEDEGVRDWSTDAATDADALVEVAGRVCYMSFKAPRPGGNGAYIANILEQAHGSVLEHAAWTVLITGVSRSLTHELVRHRVGFGFSQLSQRYVDESEVSFVVPPAFLDDPDWDDHEDDGGAAGMVREWKDHMARSLRLYEEMAGRIYCGLLVQHFPADHWIDGEGPESWVEANDAAASLPREVRTAYQKRSREAARSVLPNCAETKVVLTGNARAFRHLIELRGSAGADAEMRRLARTLFDVLTPEAPAIFGDFSESEDGTVVSAHRKV
jgi:thymidylate synthase (FAD)